MRIQSLVRKLRSHAAWPKNRKKKKRERENELGLEDKEFKQESAMQGGKTIERNAGKMSCYKSREMRPPASQRLLRKFSVSIQDSAMPSSPRRQ